MYVCMYVCIYIYIYVYTYDISNLTNISNSSKYIIHVVDIVSHDIDSVQLL